MIKTSKMYLQESDVREARQIINNLLNEIDDLVDLSQVEGATNELKRFIGGSKIKDTAENREILEQLGIIINMGSHKKKAVVLMKKAYSLITHKLSELRDNNKYANTESYRDLIDLYKRSECYLFKQMACLFNPLLFNDITIQ